MFVSLFLIQRYGKFSYYQNRKIIVIQYVIIASQYNFIVKQYIFIVIR